MEAPLTDGNATMGSDATNMEHALFILHGIRPDLRGDERSHQIVIKPHLPSGPAGPLGEFKAFHLQSIGVFGGGGGGAAGDDAAGLRNTR